jgi:hypothetical protein
MAQIAAGAALYVAFRWMNASIGESMGTSGETFPQWYVWTLSSLNAVTLLLPGVVVGYLVSKHPASSAFAAVFLGAAIYGCIFEIVWESLSGTGLGGHLVVLAQAAAMYLGTAIVGFVSGAAGSYFRGRMRSNTSLERTREE